MTTASALHAARQRCQCMPVSDTVTDGATVTRVRLSLESESVQAAGTYGARFGGPHHGLETADAAKWVNRQEYCLTQPRATISMSMSTGPLRQTGRKQPSGAWGPTRIKSGGFRLRGCTPWRKSIFDFINIIYTQTNTGGVSPQQEAFQCRASARPCFSSCFPLQCAVRCLGARVPAGPSVRAPAGFSPHPFLVCRNERAICGRGLGVCGPDVWQHRHGRF